MLIGCYLEGEFQMTVRGSCETVSAKVAELLDTAAVTNQTEVGFISRVVKGRQAWAKRIE